jgi:5-methylthioadenosine/S-adenosylhomocysteine deaminase
MERIRREDGRNPSPEHALRWATRNGYRALGVPDGGWLAPGNRADLILVDLQRAHLVPMLRAVSDFVHNGQARDVEAVMVDGKWTMRDGKVLGMNEAEIIERAQKTARDCWSRLFKRRFDIKVPEGFNPAALP